MSICAKCGADVPYGMMACPACGESVDHDINREVVDLTKKYEELEANESADSAAAGNPENNGGFVNLTKETDYREVAPEVPQAPQQVSYYETEPVAPQAPQQVAYNASEPVAPQVPQQVAYNASEPVAPQAPQPVSYGDMAVKQQTQQATYGDTAAASQTVSLTKETADTATASTETKPFVPDISGINTDIDMLAAKYDEDSTGTRPNYSEQQYGQQPYGQATYGNPYSQNQNPYGQSQNAYGQTQNAYGQTQNAYGQTQNPYGQAQNAYGQQFTKNTSYASGSSGAYANNTYSGTVMGTTAGITERNIILAILLTFVTGGIYAFYWIYKMNDEINQILGDTDDTSGGMVILFSLLTCGIYAYYWYFKMGEKCDRLKGTVNGSSNILNLVLALCGLGLVDLCLIQDSINNAVR